jgi:protein KRI1
MSINKQQTEESELLERKLEAKVEDELYMLNYEDIVAGMPTRFKYRQGKTNSCGLSTEEIIFARDSTLKQIASLKKLAP